MCKDGKTDAILITTIFQCSLPAAHYTMVVILTIRCIITQISFPIIRDNGFLDPHWMQLKVLNIIKFHSYQNYPIGLITKIKNCKADGVTS